MGKKYLRIYCNGNKIRSTGGSMKQIYSILKDYGFYDFNTISYAFKHSNAFITQNIGYTHYETGKMLVPHDIDINSELFRTINKVTMYLDYQRQPHEICVMDIPHYFTFYAEIINKHGKVKEVIKSFSLPIGLKIGFINGNKHYELISNVEFLSLGRQPVIR